MAPHGTDTQVLRESAIDHVSGGNALRAHEWISRAAMPAKSASARWIGRDYPVPSFEVSDKGSDLCDSAAELVAQHHWRPARPKALDDMDISSADTCGYDFKFHLVRSRKGFRPIGQLYVAFAGLRLDDSFHRVSRWARIGSRHP
jgi:hypothetical protein